MSSLQAKRIRLFSTMKLLDRRGILELIKTSTTGEDRAEGASFWYAFLTPFWGPKNIFFSKETMLKPMSGLSQIQDKPSKRLD